MTRSSVINASPLIFFSRGNQIGILRNFVDNLLIPEPVAEEIKAKGPEDITVKVMQKEDWIQIIKIKTIPESIIDWGLGIGESSVLAYALCNPGTEVIIDDLIGRKCASFFNIPVRGTLGIVISAKKRGLIPAARPVIESIMSCGLYLSKKVLDEALKRVEE